MDQSTTSRLLKTRLLAMMAMRAVIALSFIGVTVYLQMKEGQHGRLNFYPLYAVVIVISLLTIAYALAMRRAVNLRLFSYLQVTIDIALITVVVYVTGGLESYLPVLYFLSIIASSMLLDRAGGFYAASISSIAYGLLINFDLYRLLPLGLKMAQPRMDVSPEDVLRTAVTNILAFFVVAYLGGTLARRTSSAEKRLEEKEVDIERLENLNRRIVENISSGIVTLDAVGRITSFNKAAEYITGYPFREAYGRRMAEILGPLMEDAAVPIEAASDPAGRMERTIRRRDGSELCLGFTITSAGEVSGDLSRIVIFQDLTRLRAVEEQLKRAEKLKALGELSVGIAHEIRNPLASISGSIQVLNSDLALGGDDKKLMEIIVRETERLNALISDFLLFARPARQSRSVVLMKTLIDETVRLFRNSPQAASVTVVDSIDPAVCVEGDSRQLGQVLWNLFINAANAMPGGGTIFVRLSAERRIGGGADAVISVEDTGSGIRSADLGRIFDPFFSTRESGTGLGLAIAHRIVESHGGVIMAGNSSSGGAVFTIRLPLAETGAAA